MAFHPRTAVHQQGTVTAVSNPTSGSQTILRTDAPANATGPSATLRLRAEPEESPRVRWAEDVIDNEGMGKKSSKVCCIYHKPHEPGDSGSESDSSSSDGSESEPDLSRAQKAGGRNGRARRHEHDKDKATHGSGKGKETQRKASPNAYERQPKGKGTDTG